MTRDLESMFRDHLSLVTGGSPVRWGVDDCTAWTKSWGESLLGHEIWGPEYSSREEAYRIISEYGSLHSLWTHGLALSNVYEETFGEPDLGCVGVVDTGRYGQIGVPFVRGGLAAWRAETGGVGWIRPREATVVGWWRLATA